MAAQYAYTTWSWWSFRNRSIEENPLFEGMKMEILKKEAMFCVLKLIWLRLICWCVIHWCIVFYTVITTELETIGKSIPCMILQRWLYRANFTFYLYVRICNAQRIIQLVFWSNLWWLKSKTTSIWICPFELELHCNGKRKLLQLAENIVNGWDDPRMPTISGCVEEGIQPILFVNFVIYWCCQKRNIIDFHFWILLTFKIKRLQELWRF
jgi:hypothetical protein